MSGIMYSVINPVIKCIINNHILTPVNISLIESYLKITYWGAQKLWVILPDRQLNLGKLFKHRIYYI